MTSPDAEPGFRALIPAGVTWIDEAAARVGLHLARYRPRRLASRITCPALFCIAEHDAVTPPQLALKAAAATPRAEVRRYPVAHFEIYVGQGFERAVRDQVDFLTRHLGTGAGAEPAPP
jgi:alpha-beta hydrolase superfamily lysophospholipase